MGRGQMMARSQNILTVLPKRQQIEMFSIEIVKLRGNFHTFCYRNAAQVSATNEAKAKRCEFARQNAELPLVSGLGQCAAR
jgi:allantoicase